MTAPCVEDVAIGTPRSRDLPRPAELPWIFLLDTNVVAELAEGPLGPLARIVRRVALASTAG